MPSSTSPNGKRGRTQADEGGGTTEEGGQKPVSKRIRAQKARDAGKSPSSPPWTVVRLGAKTKHDRDAGGKARSAPGKPSHPVLKLSASGCAFEAPARNGPLGMLTALTRWLAASNQELTQQKVTTSQQDFNEYRSNRAPQPVHERAVSLCALDTYSRLRKMMPNISDGIADGDLGENILIQGPPSRAALGETAPSEEGFRVGMQLRFSSGAEIELCHINNPCYRLANVPWNAAAKEAFDWTSASTDKKGWWLHPKLPLNVDANPGGRGWLAKVVKEGDVRVGDEVVVVVEGGEQ